MMNGGNPIVFSRGIQMSNINGKINKEEYEAMYDGQVGKAIVKKNDGKICYIEADQNDIKVMGYVLPWLSSMWCQKSLMKKQVLPCICMPFRI